MKEKIILVGTGQHFNVVLYNLREQGKYEVACAIDANASNRGKTLNGVYVEEIYENLEELKRKYGTNKFFISFGSMKYRREVYKRFVSMGWESVNIIHPDAVVSPEAKLGKGILIECGCLVTPNPLIGDNVVINTGSQVNHDNIVESHVYIASGVILSGGVTIKENTLLDDGVIVTLGTTVGADSIIGAGAVVTKNTSDKMVVYGNPAKEIRVNDNIGK
ncbi:MAG: NeuD/PglB/VioB family sugar acetyltransferase [Eubacterium sp.]|nr:NeuD/PglB/VioB family sugar acetyltransferase [Eubacterium sp.]